MITYHVIEHIFKQEMNTINMRVGLLFEYHSFSFSIPILLFQMTNIFFGHSSLS